VGISVLFPRPWQRRASAVIKSRADKTSVPRRMLIGRDRVNEKEDAGKLGASREDKIIYITLHDDGFRDQGGKR